ncbi:hypothetical protein AN216_21595 [Streptomyces oceani]|uniref:ABC transporter permease n=1 Tax=Streptomyces oceani TaxID=1075402 RepID=A0A1E7JX96_9ACTN|nr:hypothetical protein AN216_21595 [Streptomyces oceani]
MATAPATPRPSGVRGHWAAYRAGPFFPATMLALILTAAAGLFAGSYTYAMADPTPNDLPVAVVSKSALNDGKSARFLAGLEKALDSEMDLRRMRSYEDAQSAVEDQRVFAVLRFPSDQSVKLGVASAAGDSVAQVLTETAPQVAETTGVRLSIDDLKPLDRGDPRGLALFYISLAAVIIGFVGAVQLNVHAKGLNPPERIAFTALYSLMGGFVIHAVVRWLLDAVALTFPLSWVILSLTMFASGMVFTMFNTLFGRWAIIPTWGLMVLLGNPSSGGAVSWPLLPSPLGEIGRWLPPGASVNAQHTAVYFPEAQHPGPYLVLAGWAILSCAVFWIWRHRHPGGREPGEPALVPP